MRKMNLIPLCLVTGFLGSGKTTFLRHLVAQHRKRKLTYIVNEFSPVDVDGARLELPEGQMLSVAGGSIFCRCKAAEFIKVMREASRGDKCKGVIVEVSGIADPAVIGLMLEESRLNRLFALGSIVTVVDPGTFLKLATTLPAVVEQVRAATTILLNKSDLYPTAQLEQTERELRSVNPVADVLRTEHCRARVHIFGRRLDHPLRGRYAPCADPRFCTVAVQVPCRIDLGVLRAEIDAAAQDLFRVKGFVNRGSSWHYWDWSNGLWTIEPSTAQGYPALVLIGRGEARGRLDLLRKRIESYGA